MHFHFGRGLKCGSLPPLLPRLLIMQGAKTYFDSFLPFSTAKLQRRGKMVVADSHVYVRQTAEACIQFRLASSAFP